MLGFTSVMAPRRIARSVYCAAGFVLRPAESAVRRLIYLVSLSIRVKPATIRPMPSGLAGTRGANARCAFRLFDPRLRLVLNTKNKAKAARAQPRISFFGDGEVRTVDLSRMAKPVHADSEIDASRLLRRLEAIKSALDDLPRQARRLKRALQRRQRVPSLKMRGRSEARFSAGTSRAARA